MDKVYLGLGSNRGDGEGGREAALARASALLRENGVKVVRESRIYETEPVGFSEQPWFLNQVIEVHTLLKPGELLVLVLKIEKEMGRVRTSENRWGPRVIDIDILFYGAQVVKAPGLEIPHARMTERRFVLEPFCEIGSELKHPVLKKSIKEILKECPDQSIVKPR